jgi:hypothetical protein
LVVDLLSGNLLGTIKLASEGNDQGTGNAAAPVILPVLPSVNVPPRNKSEGLK